MNKLKHTPAPWTVTFQENCDWVINGSNGYNIVAIPHDEESGNSLADNANANLIAAAPELLAALELLLIETRNIMHHDTVWARSEAIRAIEKAKGK